MLADADGKVGDLRLRVIALLAGVPGAAVNRREFHVADLHGGGGSMDRGRLSMRGWAVGSEAVGTVVRSM